MERCAAQQEKEHELLIRAIIELAYVQDAETLEQCASNNGAEIVRLGQELLGEELRERIENL